MYFKPTGNINFVTDTLFFEHAHPIAEPPHYIICFMNNYEKVCKK